MIEYIFFELIKNNFIFSIGLSIVLYILFVTQWLKATKNISFIKNYPGVQRVHDGEVPRLGGLVIIIGLFFYSLFDDNKEIDRFFNIFLISSIPIILISLKEDLFYSTSPKARLICMFISTILFFTLYDISFPSIEIPILGELLNNSFGLSLIFFSLCVLVVINGSNIIDGSNGLLSMTVIMQILCLMYICHISNDSINMVRLLIILSFLILFFIFNYPYGKIFLGDCGAYILGFAISIITIIIFSQHPNIPTWLAVLILFYPSIELFFSIIRKLLNHKNPMKPDLKHLHLKMYYLFKNQIDCSYIANSLVMPALFFVWGMPFIILVWVIDSLFLTLIGISFITFSYIAFYLNIPEKKN
jgi:UDP-GlcNAc:undecaprenyl-phosphate GlcNAc-1-phosphate transferase